MRAIAFAFTLEGLQPTCTVIVPIPETGEASAWLEFIPAEVPENFMRQALAERYPEHIGAAIVSVSMDYVELEIDTDSEEYQA